MHPPDLFPHQTRALPKMHNGCVLYALPGSGKSRVAATYYIKNEAPKDVYVITTAKKRDSLDWDREFARYGVGRGRDSTVAGIVTIDSWNKLDRYTDIKNAFFIFDEQRLVGSGLWTKSFIQIAKSNNWIMLSATPGDTWLDYIPVFIANGWYKNRTEFKREHVVYNTFSKFPKVDHYVSVGKLVRLRNELLVEMPYARHTIRKNITVPVEYDEDIFEMVTKKKWNPYTNKPLKNVAEMFSLMRKVVNTDPSRLEAVKCLMKKHPKLIVFYNFDYELEMLRQLKSFETGSENDLSLISSTTSGITSPTSFKVAEWNGHKHEPLPTTDNWIYLVQYVAGAEAWDCTETDATIFFALTYSYKNFEQAHGRIDRMNTKFKVLYYYTLLSSSIIDQGVARSLKHKEDFQERKFVDIDF
jgi:hypothetical protein